MRSPARTLLSGLALGSVVITVAACGNGPADPEAQEPPPAVDAPAGSASLAEDILVFASNRSGGFEIHAAPLAGGEPRQLTDDDRFDSWWPRVSPDRTRILFYRTPRGVHDTDYARAALWMMAADGSDAVELLPAGSHGWRLQGHAEWSPDGTELVMFGGTGPGEADVFVTDITGQAPRAVTDRPGVDIDPSWAPDGERIAFVGCPDARCVPERFEVYTVAADGSSEPQRMTEDDLRDQDPYFSPDGERIAWLTQTSTSGGPLGAWNIRTADPDGSNLRWVTDDANVNSKPEWSPDGSTIYFHRLTYADSKQFKLWRIGVDGSGLEPVFDDQPGVNEFPSL